MRTKIKMLMVVAVLLLSLAVQPTEAYQQGTPYTVTVNYIVPTDTTFTITLAGSETTVDFNPANKNSANVEPDSQNAGASTPMFAGSNAGNIAQGFWVNLTAPQYSWVAITLSNASDYSNPITLSATGQTPTGWSSVPAGGSFAGYMKATFTNAPGGTNSKTLQIGAQP